MKYKKIFLIFSLLICILFSISFAAAGVVNDTAVTSNVDDAEIASADENQVIGQSNDDLIAENDKGSFTELEANIILTPENGTLSLEKDYSFNVDSNITTGVLINKNITIDGNGHALDGKSKSRIFTIFFGLKDNNYVTLKNIVFKNGFSNMYGGAILNFARLTVDNCTFINNYAYIAGGAINSLGGIDLKNSRFDKNVADGSAGAVFSLSFENSFDYFKYSNLTLDSISNLPLITSIGIDGLIKHSTDHISNCVFTNNKANSNGGAVYAFSNIDIKSSTFNSNRAGEKGGAVFGNKDLYIKNSKFNKNRALMYGGAVYFRCHELSGYYENGEWITSIKYYSNLIENSAFTSNVADERGGAIYGFRMSSSDNVHCAKAVKCTFDSNKAPNGKDIYGGIAKNCVYKKVKIALKTVKVKKSAKKLVLSATFKKASDAIKNKKVTFKFNGKTYSAKTNSKGIAKVTIKSNVLKKLTAGKKIKYQAAYAGVIAKKTAKVYK